MAKLSVRIHELIALRLRELYNGIVDQGVPNRLAAILTTADEDLVALAAATPAVLAAASATA
jgi:hypothetical protein